MGSEEGAKYSFHGQKPWSQYPTASSPGSVTEANPATWAGRWWFRFHFLRWVLASGVMGPRAQSFGVVGPRARAFGVVGLSSGVSLRDGGPFGKAFGVVGPRAKASGVVGPWAKAFEVVDPRVKVFGIVDLNTGSAMKEANRGLGY